MKYLLLLVLLVGGTAYSTTGLQYLIFDTSGYEDETYDPQLARGTDILDTRLRYRLSIEHGYRFYETGEFSLNWDSAVIGKSTESQFRYVAWDTGLSMKIARVEVYYHHLSEHLMDSGYVGHYPVANRVGLRWTLYGGK